MQSAASLYKCKSYFYCDKAPFFSFLGWKHLRNFQYDSITEVQSLKLNTMKNFILSLVILAIQVMPHKGPDKKASEMSQIKQNIYENCTFSDRNTFHNNSIKDQGTPFSAIQYQPDSCIDSIEIITGGLGLE
jgi:hypothetical protein